MVASEHGDTVQRIATSRWGGSAIWFQKIVLRIGWYPLLLCSCLCLAAAAPAPASGNAAVAFFNGAQCEPATNGQRTELRHVLRDLLRKPARALPRLRYRDYSGKGRAWSATTLLEYYCLPAHAKEIDPDRFYRDVRTPEARSAVSALLKALS
ncbi:MAG TPA: hypothetical protein VFG62_04035 [Rhodopila sp.]|nr:hypothetical protein [Rhodopila sp.]